ncbi:hypothetical protein ACSBR2_004818 [Camellia fascicularis]
MQTCSNIEHEAFLVVWLSRFVFPARPIDTIGKHVFSIAVLLASGTKITLVSAALARLGKIFKFEAKPEFNWRWFAQICSIGQGDKLNPRHADKAIK